MWIDSKQLAPLGHDVTPSRDVGRNTDPQEAEDCLGTAVAIGGWVVIFAPDDDDGDRIHTDERAIPIPVERVLALGGWHGDRRPTRAPIVVVAHRRGPLREAHRTIPAIHSELAE